MSTSPCRLRSCTSSTTTCVTPDSSGSEASLQTSGCEEVRVCHRLSRGQSKPIYTVNATSHMQSRGLSHITSPMHREPASLPEPVAGIVLTLTSAAVCRWCRTAAECCCSWRRPAAHGSPLQSQAHPGHLHTHTATAGVVLFEVTLWYFHIVTYNLSTQLASDSRARLTRPTCRHMATAPRALFCLGVLALFVSHTLHQSTNTLIAEPGAPGPAAGVAQQHTQRLDKGSTINHNRREGAVGKLALSIPQPGHNVAK
jgi:hypothetical protein